MEDGRQCSQHVNNVEEHILDAVAERPGASTRRLAFENNVSHMTVWRLLRMQQLYSYHVQRVQFLRPGDLQLRREFCEWILAKINVQLRFLRYLLQTDEASFTREGIFNLIVQIKILTLFVNAIFKSNFLLFYYFILLDGRLIGPYNMNILMNQQ